MDWAPIRPRSPVEPTPPRGTESAPRPPVGPNQPHAPPWGRISPTPPAGGPVRQIERFGPIKSGNGVLVSSVWVHSIPQCGVRALPDMNQRDYELL